jgi:hypothetical protein
MPEVRWIEVDQGLASEWMRSQEIERILAVDLNPTLEIRDSSDAALELHLIEPCVDPPETAL